MKKMALLLMVLASTSMAKVKFLIEKIKNLIDREELKCLGQNYLGNAAALRRQIGAIKG